MDDLWRFPDISFLGYKSSIYMSQDGETVTVDLAIITGELHRFVVSLKVSEHDEQKKICWYCNKESEAKLKICSKCTKARYCSVDCQRAHWSEHKKICKGMENID